MLNNIDYKALGEHWKQTRLSAGLTLKQTGEKIGKSAQTISTWENGKTGHVLLDNIDKMADLYGVTVTYLLGFDK
jgi:repressor LexA